MVRVTKTLTRFLGDLSHLESASSGIRIVWDPPHLGSAARGFSEIVISPSDSISPPDSRPDALTVPSGMGGEIMTISSKIRSLPANSWL